MSKQQKELIFNNIIDGSSEGLRKIKVAMLSELEWDLEKAQSILDNLPSSILISDNQEEIQKIYTILTNAGAEIIINDLSIDSIKEIEKIPSEGLFFEIDPDELTDDDTIDLVGRRYDSLALVNQTIEAENNKEDKEKEPNNISKDIEKTVEEVDDELRLRSLAIDNKEDTIETKKPDQTKIDLSENQEIDEKKNVATLQEPTENILIKNKIHNPKILKESSIQHDNFSINKAIKNEHLDPANLNESKNIRNNTIIGVSVALLVSFMSFLVFKDRSTNSQSQIESQVSVIKDIEKIKNIKNREIKSLNFIKKIKIENMLFNFDIQVTDNKVQDIKLNISADKAIKRDITIEELINQTKTVTLEKMILSNVKIKQLENNSFIAQSQLRIYLDFSGEKLRPLADVVFSGNYDILREQIDLRMLVNNGFTEKPERLTFELDSFNPEKFKLFIDEKITIEASY